MEGYYPVKIIDTSNQKGGGWVHAWQHVKDGQQVGFVTDDGLPIAPPDVHEVFPLSTDLHFAPGVLRDPNAYVEPTMAEFQAAVASGPDAYKAWVDAQWAAKNAADVKAATPVAAEPAKV